MALGAEDCWRMVQTLMCGNNHMIQKGDMWHFASRLRSTQNICSSYKTRLLPASLKVTLQILPGSKAVYSFHGKSAITRAVGFSVRADTTFVWSAQETSQTSECDVVSTFNGTAQLDLLDLKEKDVPSVLRLVDRATQVDFYFGRQKILCEKLEAFKVVGEPDIFTVHRRVPSTADVPSPSHYINATEHP